MAAVATLEPLLVTMCALFSGSASFSFAVAQTVDLQYQNRGDRHEGIKPKPVAGDDVELISARVDYTEDARDMPDRLKLRFHLEQPSAVHVTVRELDYVHYYWMDRVQPPEPWRPGFGNVFEWPTRAVIRQLRDLRMYELGAVARLGTLEPSRVERVAPVILYHTRPPDSVKGYLFTFRTYGDARLTGSIYRQGATTPVFVHPIPRQPGARPFTIRWDASRAPLGAYSLVLRGHSLDTNARIDQTVSFRHQPEVR